MNRKNLVQFIQKYHLNGICPHAVIKSDGSGISCLVGPEEKNMAAYISMKDVTFGDKEFGVFDTSQLLKILSVFDNDIEIESFDERIKFSDKNLESDFVLSDIEIIPNPPKIKEVPDMDLVLKLDSNFIGKFLKAKAALSDALNFGISVDDDGIKIIVNYSEFNVTNIKIPIEGEVIGSFDTVLTFPIEYMKEVLTANSDSTSVECKVTSSGLMELKFVGENYEALYYLIKFSN